MIPKMIKWILINLLIPLSFGQVSDNNCIIDAGNEYKFNITQLSKNKQDYVIEIEDTDKKIKFQFCKKLDNCDGKKDAEACLQIGSKKLALGYYRNTTIKDGNILLNYTGDKCKENTNYSFSIEMMCDYCQDENQSKIELIPSVDECNFKVRFKTILVCPDTSDYHNPKIKVDCTVKNDSTGSIYDLSPLMKCSDNYKVAVNDTTKIIFNVCHKVIHGNEAICQSAACLSNSNKNMGDLNSPSLEKNNLQIVYKDGALCSNGLHSQTTINFICDLNGINTEPEFSRVENICHYELKWKTQFACSKELLEQHNSCKIDDPEQTKQYNLKSLADKIYDITTKTAKYTLGICRSMNNCPGICKTDNVSSISVIGGRVNSTLQISEDGPFLNYTDGALCNNNSKLFTIIQFLCGPNETLKFIEDKSCRWIVHFFTPLVCKNKIVSCNSTSNGSVCVESQVNKVAVPSESPPTSSVNSITSGIFIVVLLINVILIIVLSNAQRRLKMKIFLTNCCCWYFPKPDFRVKYSRVNTHEETDALTHSHSDSDDDLLIM